MSYDVNYIGYVELDIADILFTVHRVPPSCRSMVLTLLITYSKGAPFYNAITTVTDKTLEF
jgi:hypothetical protein